MQQKRAASLVDRLFALLEPTSEEEEDEEEEEEVTKNAVGPLAALKNKICESEAEQLQLLAELDARWRVAAASGAVAAAAQQQQRQQQQQHNNSEEDSDIATSSSDIAASFTPGQFFVAGSWSGLMVLV